MIPYLFEIMAEDGVGKKRSLPVPSEAPQSCKKVTQMPHPFPTHRH